MNDFSRILQVIKSRKSEKFVMGTVTAVEGSSYRSEGSKMLIDERGGTFGLISGGCLEGDMVRHANEVYQTGKSKIVSYDLRAEDDLGWGRGTGCNGTIYVYLEVVGWNIAKDNNGYSIWEKIDNCLISGLQISSLKLYDDNTNASEVIYLSEAGEIFGETKYSEHYLGDLQQFLKQEKKVEIVLLKNKKILMELYKPEEPLFIFGAGEDVEPLAELASRLDFSVRIIDPRKARCNRQNFPEADQFIIEFPHIYVKEHKLSRNSFVIIITHYFQWDKELVNHFMKYPPNYLGILGPKERTKRLLHPNPVPSTIHSPIGLEIFAEGAEEIAVSICAELIKVRHQISRINKVNSLDGVNLFL